MKYFSQTRLIALLTLSVLFFGATFLSADTSVYGWLWGGSDDGAGINTGIGWISMSNTTGGGAISYSVSIPVDDGDLSGYAYSENMGYIAFDNMAGYLTGCPSGTCAAYREGDTIKGWARFVGIADAGVNAGGNEGWIHLSGTAQDSSPYGVTINPDGTLSGYAWSDEFGAIYFGQSGVSATSECTDGIDNDDDDDIDLDDGRCESVFDTTEGGAPEVSLYVNGTSSAEVAVNESVNISWDTVGAYSCWASSETEGWGGWITPGAGLQSVTVTHSDSFYLECWDQDNSTLPECSDGVDNDRDGNIDGHDGGCSDAYDTSE